MDWFLYDRDLRHERVKDLNLRLPIIYIKKQSKRFSLRFHTVFLSNIITLNLSITLNQQVNFLATQPINQLASKISRKFFLHTFSNFLKKKPSEKLRVMNLESFEFNASDVIPANVHNISLLFCAYIS